MSADRPIPAPGPGTPLSRPTMVHVAVGAVAAGALGYWQPLVGLGVALVLLVATVLRDVPVARLGAPLLVLTAVAAMFGPNLGVPAAPEVFAFRVLAVVLAVGAAGYLLMDGRLALPAAISRPAGLLGLLVVWFALSIAWADDRVAAVRWTALFLMMGALAVAIAMLCASARRARVLLAALGATFVVACLVAAAEVAVPGFHLPSFRTEADALTAGLFGTGSLFGNENNFAVYLTLTLPYLLAVPVVFRDVRLRALGIAGSVVALVLVLTTGSKTGLVSTGLILLGLLMLVGSDRRRRGRLVAAAGVAALAVLLVVPALGGRGPVRLDQRTVTKLSFDLLGEQVQSQSGSGGVRSALLSDGLGIVGDTHYRGVGAGNAEGSVRALASFPGVGNLHNWWLEILVNGGLVAFALYLAFFASLLGRQARIARRATHPLVRYMALAGCLALVGFIAGSLGPSTALAFAPMWIAFGLGMGTLALARRLER